MLEAVKHAADPGVQKSELAGNSKSKLDPATLKRDRPKQPEKKPEPPPVSAGPIDRVMEFAFNPSREKIREVTSIDRIQGRLLPQLDIIDLVWQYFIDIALYREDSRLWEETHPGYKAPVLPNLINEFTYRTAQWQKSIGGMNLKSAVDLALAEIETKSEQEEPFGGHGFDED